MELERPLYWHQGLFLQPQHFQLLERSLHALLIPFYDFTEPNFWGVAETEIETTALGTRSFSIFKGKFLFFDGTYAAFPGNALIEPRFFEEGWVEGDRPLTVYVGLRKWNPHGENVTVLEKSDSTRGVNTRFVSFADAEEVNDLHSTGPSAPVKRLHLVLKLLWEQEREQFGDHVMMPIARLERIGEEIRLSERFIPPCLTVSASEPLMRLLREVRDQVAARSRQLEEHKVQRGIQTAEFGSRDMVYLLALRSLNRYVPMIFQYLEARQIHPWAFYGLLRQLIGELSTFSERVDVLGRQNGQERALPGYDHHDLWKCFATAQDLVTLLLDEITAGPEYVIRLMYDGTYFAAELRPAVFEGRNRFYLVLKTEDDPKSVLQSITTIAKLSSREHLPLLIARALPGIRLEHLPIPPQELPRRAHSIYFAVDHHSEQWNPVQKAKNMALYWDDAPEDLEAELMVVSR